MQQTKLIETKNFIAVKADSFYHGIGIYEVRYEYGEDYVYFAEETNGKKEKTHKSKIRYNKKGEPFFVFQKKREYINNYLKVK